MTKRQRGQKKARRLEHQRMLAEGKSILSRLESCIGERVRVTVLGKQIVGVLSRKGKSRTSFVVDDYDLEPTIIERLEKKSGQRYEEVVSAN